MKKLVPVFFLLILVNLGCKSDSVSTTSNNVLMPLKVGNTWIYEDQVFSEDGTNTHTANDTITIVSSQVVAGITYYTSNYGANYYYDSKGLWVLVDNVHHFFAKYPLAPGEIMPADTIVITKESSPDPLDNAIGIQKLVGENMTVHFPNNVIYTCQQFQRDYKGIKYDTIYSSVTTSYQLGTGLVFEQQFLSTKTGGHYIANARSLIKYDLK